MKLSRREFLKIGLGAAAAVVAPAILAIDEPMPERYVQFNCGTMPPGDYGFSFYAQKAGETEWRRHFQVITLDDEMELRARADLEPGDLLSYPQMEPISPSRIATNYVIQAERSVELQKAYSTSGIEDLPAYMDPFAWVYKAQP
jgi:hypothetical protein